MKHIRDLQQARHSTESSVLAVAAIELVHSSPSTSLAAPAAGTTVKIVTQNLSQ